MKGLILVNNSLKKSRETAQKVKDALEKLNISVVMNETEKPDFIVSVGGDGTILHSSELALKLDIPILGVNVGHLGFLATVEGDNLEPLSHLKENLEIEELMLLDIYVNGEFKGSVLNEITVTREGYSGIVDVEVTVDNSESFNYRADGIIVSTPTGSSAYSFSAGGPIIEKTAKAIMITPLCPHSLMNRSLIISPERSLKIKAHSRSKIVLLSDGNNNAVLNEETEIVIKKSEKTLKIISFPENNYFRVIKNKLL